MKGTKDTIVNADPGFWDGYYGYGWGSPYVATEPVVKFETSTWDPSGVGKIVWSAMTETENPTSGKNFTMSLTKEVIPKMTQKPGSCRRLRDSRCRTRPSGRIDLARRRVERVLRRPRAVPSRFAYIWRCRGIESGSRLTLRRRHLGSLFERLGRGVL